jgi:hypothetical protein
MPGPWHTQWQALFSNTEVPMPQRQHRNRRADALLEGVFIEFQDDRIIQEGAHESKEERKEDTNIVFEDVVIEFQHSYISQQEVDERKADYALNNKGIIWVINCTTALDVPPDSKSNKWFIALKRSWKYKSFSSYSRIYLDYGVHGIYECNPSNVCSKISIPVYLFCKTREDFQEEIIGNKKDLHSLTREPTEPSLTIYQRMAGSGKTYFIAGFPMDKKYDEYINFIYLTKTHSAKKVIYDEIIHRSSLKREDSHVDNKTYDLIVNDKKIRIGTIDSLIYSQCVDKPENKLMYFEDMVNKLIDANELSKNSYKNIKLSYKTLIILDEVQDVRLNYINALTKISSFFYVDMVCVGDKLQSIYTCDNVYSNEIKLQDDWKVAVDHRKDDDCHFRRSEHNPSVKRFINKCVDFKTHGLSNLRVKCKEGGSDCKECRTRESSDSVKLFYMPDRRNFIEGSMIDFVWDIFRKEIDTHGYDNPDHYTILFPIISQNNLAVALEERINYYWTDYFKSNPDKLEKYKLYLKDKYEINNVDETGSYTFFHKSDNYGPIDLTESDGLTKIMSIHASKGTGNDVIIVMSMFQSLLNSFSSDKLMHKSMLYVALTRTKHMVYMGINDTDDIYIRCKRAHEKVCKDEIDCKFRGDLVGVNVNIQVKDESISRDDKTQFYETVYKNTPVSMCDDEKKTNTKKINIDMTHHITRYIACKNLIQFKINYYSDGCRTDGYFFLSKNIMKLSCIVLDNAVTYFKFLDLFHQVKKASKEKDIMNMVFKSGFDLDKNDLDHYSFFKNNRKITKFSIKRIPIFPNAKHPIYTTILHDIIDKLCSGIITKTNMDDLCLLEHLVLGFIVEIQKRGKYSGLTPTSIYRVMHEQQLNGINEYMHSKCKCRHYFSIHHNTNDKQTFYNKIRPLNEVCRAEIDKIRFTEMIARQEIHSFTCMPAGLLAYHFSDVDLIETRSGSAVVIVFQPDISELNKVSIIVNTLLKIMILLYDKKWNSDDYKYNKVSALIFSLNIPRVRTMSVTRNKDNEYFVHNLIQFTQSTFTNSYWPSIKSAMDSPERWRQTLNRQKTLRDNFVILKDTYDDNGEAAALSKARQKIKNGILEYFRHDSSKENSSGDENSSSDDEFIR